MLVSSVLDEAMRDGLIPANPARRARLPKLEKHKADFLKPSEIAALLNAADSEPLLVKQGTYIPACSQWGTSGRGSGLALAER